VSQLAPKLATPIFSLEAALGSKRLLWERMRALFYDYQLGSMRELLEALFYGLKKSRPAFAIDSS
jgi:hypothetical protein